MKCTTLSDALFLPQNVQIIKSIFRAREDELWAIEKSVDSPLDEKALQPLLEEVAAEVNLLLDSNFALPSIVPDCNDEYSGYLPGKISIGYGEMLLNNIYSIIAHEYMHHVAKLCLDSGRNWYRSKALEEGMARGIELKIAELYSTKLDSSCFKKKPLQLACNDMAMLIDKANGKKMPGQLSMDPFLQSINRKDEDIMKYAFGTSALLLAERMHGDIVYRRLIKSTRPYRLLVGFLSGDARL